ncbi:MAG: POTRA domain-containing protein [Pyrinomonadaceae bacterium]
MPPFADQFRGAHGSFQYVGQSVFAVLLTLFVVGATFAQAEFEGKKVDAIRLILDGAEIEAGTNESYFGMIRDEVGTAYSTVRIRNAIDELYSQKDILTVEVKADPGPGDAVELTFVIRRKPKAKSVSLTIGKNADLKVTEQELLFKLNLLDPGAVVTEETLQANANSILEYLRERGFLRARVEYEQKPLNEPNEVGVTFTVTPGEPARVETLAVDVDGFDSAEVKKSLKLQPGEIYKRELLQGDTERVRSALIKEGFLAPTIEESTPVYDGDTNTVGIRISGKSGPVVEVDVESEKGKLGSGTKNRLLPVSREGTLDFAAIIEGDRRLENYYQEQGYFFAEVTPVCSIVPVNEKNPDAAAAVESEAQCSSLSSTDLADKKAVVKYNVDLDRRLKLNDIRLQGTSLFTINEILPVLESQRANILGIIPVFGYGRGYTSERILEQDTATIRSLLRELGYRDATVRSNRGVSLNGEDLIITFVVEQGEPTIITDVAISGNSALTDTELKAQLPELVGKNFSRAKIRNGERKLREFYSKAGYYYAAVDYSVDESARTDPDAKRTVKVLYTIRNESKPVYIRRILITGNENAKTDSIRRAVVLREGELLKSTEIYQSEQNLYESDVFSLVEIKPQPAGDRPDGAIDVDVIVNVTEQAPRIATYGGGFSTDVGVSGFVDLRHLNLFGKLWQGGVRLSYSQRRQIIQLDFVDPRFIREKGNRFAPLTISAQYQRDSTVTRFFRSAFDRGTFGIVQRVDANGVPIDEFGQPAGDPTINRLSLFAETNRTLSRKSRSAVFFRYKFEDVRLFNIQSLLIRDLLLPDSRIRTSGFGVTFVRDTRKNCSTRYTILDIIEKGESTDPCRYNASDPTHGDYLTAEYNVSVPTLGANIGFNKFQASYNFFRTFPKFRNTTFAARAILGLAGVFKENTRFGPPDFPGLENILPISERFFAGGSNTLRGFEFESAGPRIVVAPQGDFRNSRGEIVTLDPFTIPFGGNALAVVNLEARMPVSNSIRLVPFYDGGNVFRRVGDLFKTPTVPVTDFFQRNLLVKWSHTVGLGFRIKTPVGGEFAIDYGYLLNSPKFFIPQTMGPPAIFQPSPGKFHFRFSQAF